ncbi:hypothetical protein [Pseudomonas frederiksbergensis]|uniref:hypothetical protein n=1 Tax=Pseudomonas frederiksbergensis TaxID=104087 RepID=UPI0011CDC02D|nr:hypothetical protein [Pseudomonas frederiksbergensis]
MKNWIEFKEEMARRVEGPRVLLVGDSNVLFGMDSSRVEGLVGIPVINMGLHGGLPLDRILNVALETARSGDVVVLPLVWNYYINDYSDPEDWMIDQIIAWDREYFDGLSMFRKLQYAKAISAENIYRNIIIKFNSEAVIKLNPLRRQISKEEMMTVYNEKSTSNPYFLYSYINFNGRGDMRNTCGVLVPVTSATYSIKDKLNDKSVGLLVNVVKVLRAKGVAVFIAAPVQIDDEFTRGEPYQSFLAKTWKQLGDHGLPLAGSPTDFFFPKQSFFNTPFHLNCESNGDRADRLGKLLLSVMPAAGEKLSAASSKN